MLPKCRLDNRQGWIEFDYGIGAELLGPIPDLLISSHICIEMEEIRREFHLFGAGIALPLRNILPINLGAVDLYATCCRFRMGCRRH